MSAQNEVTNKSYWSLLYQYFF